MTCVFVVHFTTMGLMMKKMVEDCKEIHTQCPYHNIIIVSWNLNTLRFLSVMKDTPNRHPLTFGDGIPRDIYISAQIVVPFKATMSLYIVDIGYLGKAHCATSSTTNAWYAYST